VPDTKTITKGDYQAPVLRVLGSLHAMTLEQDKMFGSSDGFTFMGAAITNASVG
jgi:hypothetical protein